MSNVIPVRHSAPLRGIDEDSVVIFRQCHS